MEEDGTRWPVTVLLRNSTALMSGGWVKYVRARALDLGDEVTFELVAEAQLKVTVKRCTDPKCKEALIERQWDRANRSLKKKSKAKKYKHGRCDCAECVP